MQQLIEGRQMQHEVEQQRYCLALQLLSKSCDSQQNLQELFQKVSVVSLDSAAKFVVDLNDVSTNGTVVCQPWGLCGVLNEAGVLPNH